MKHPAHIAVPLSISGLFFSLDLLFKYVARTNPDFTAYFVQPWLGWEYFANPDIAFSLPVPGFLVVLLTPAIVAAILWLFYRQRQKQSFRTTLGTFLIVFGALSNFIDRIFFQITVDYLRIITSVINLADVMIIVGALLLIFRHARAKSHPQLTEGDAPTKL